MHIKAGLNQYELVRFLGIFQSRIFEAKFAWLGSQDSNLDQLIQSQPSYR